MSLFCIGLQAEGLHHLWHFISVTACMSECNRISTLAMLPIKISLQTPRVLTHFHARSEVLSPSQTNCAARTF